MAAEWQGLKDLDGNTQNLQDYRGKVVLLFTVQWNCGGCQANAPRIGKIAMKFQGKSFQALGPDVNLGTTDNLRYFEGLLKGTNNDLKFPLLMGIPSSQLTSAQDGRKWSLYDAYRDVYFVIDHTGKIVYRLDGDRRQAVTEQSYTGLENALTAAIANIPTVSIVSNPGRQGLCLQACKRNGAYHIDLTSGGRNISENVTLKIMDNQGRIIRDLNWNSNLANSRQALWNGMDAKGSNVAWGTYFLSATTPGQSISLLLSWLP